MISARNLHDHFATNAGYAAAAEIASDLEVRNKDCRASESALCVNSIA